MRSSRSITVMCGLAARMRVQAKQRTHEALRNVLKACKMHSFCTQHWETSTQRAPMIANGFLLVMILATIACMKTNETYLAELAERNPSIECLEAYRGATVKIKHRCRVCGHEWLVRPTTLVSANPKGCPHCAAVKAGKSRACYTTESFSARLKNIHPEITFKGEYEGSKEKAEFICNRCGHSWIAMPYSVLQGHGCPRCAKSGTSFMEQVFLEAIRLSLKGIDVLSRDKKAIGEELDIYIPSLRIALEPGSWLLHKNRIWKDLEKRAACEAAGIRLIVIYDKFPEGESSPFQNDCLTFSGDFNKEDHRHLWEMVETVLSLMGIEADFDNEQKALIERNAYEASKSLTHEAFVERMAAAHPDIEVRGKYLNANRRIECKCRKCGRVWKAVPANLLAGDGCWDCARKMIGEKERVPFEEFAAILHEVNPDIEVDKDSFEGTHSIVTATCRKCGRTWNPVARTLIRKNPCGCSACRALERQKARNSHYRAELSKAKPYITCLEEYRNRQTKLLHRCNICGYEWRSTPVVVLKSVYGCPNWQKHQE